jgi:pimeloyl-ACP methyl ester carboxylesterase
MQDIIFGPPIISPFLVPTPLERLIHDARFAPAAPVRPKPKRSRQPVLPDPDSLLLSLAQAARRLAMSTKTLRAHVEAGHIRYVNNGHGRERERMTFTLRDLEDFVAAHTQTKAPQCPSTSQRARRSITSTSSGEVVAFTARRKGRTGAKRKP